MSSYYKRRRESVKLDDFTPEELDARLEAYNAWLRDPNREIGTSVYPGYPKTEKETKVEENVIETKVEETLAKVTKAMRKPVSKGPSKLMQAVDIVKANPDRKTAIASIMEALNVTKNNAGVYYIKVTKLTANG